MNIAEPIQEWNTGSDADAADHEAQLSRQRVLKWVFLGLFVAAGLITLIWGLLIAFSLALLLLWVPAILLAGALVAAVWRWS